MWFSFLSIFCLFLISNHGLGFVFTPQVCFFSMTFGAIQNFKNFQYVYGELSNYA